MSTVLASAADRRYGWHLLNLLGSIQRNSPLFDRIVVFDLGLDDLQARLLHAVQGVEVRRVPPFVPHWAQGFTWKPWIWTHVEADSLVYLDAGVTVLRSLEPVLAAIDRLGYFVVSQDRPLGEIVPLDYWDLYEVPHTAADRVYVAAGIVGFDTRRSFYNDVVVPTYEDCLLGRNVGYSPAEAEKLNFGLASSDEVVIRDCAMFRHDQTILNIHLLRALPDATVADVARFAGWRSAHDHPEQVIWSHRRRGDFRYLPRVRYRGVWAAVGLFVGSAIRTRSWGRAHRWLGRPSTYTGKLRRLSGR